MKRIKTKLLIVLLLALAVFAYHSYTSIGDSDVIAESQKMVEKKLANTSKLDFEQVEIVQKSEFKEGESYRVCGLYRQPGQEKPLPFVASVSISDGHFSEHGQLIVSETPELQFSIEQLCVKKQNNG